ncbi:hypothetical protein BU14_0406s0010 [Porphyra umbilicalis]|uniref:Uncharacterized protein n=1 Tax=Porphyra umbilicalis TaxID=2786 RepID=A0A1X6NVY4_PORUM|nr:hypothetical protein BU14_0406s0010 [Porphyra umbilicalis]|eukprot:OSX72771.1 hypothetical protein BU14_0406s0010 [Porphyra umbilicalis]
MRPFPVANIKTAEHRVFHGPPVLFVFSDKATAAFTLSHYLLALCCHVMLLNALNGRAAIVTSIRRRGRGRRSQLCPRRRRRQAAAPATPRFKTSAVSNHHRQVHTAWGRQMTARKTFLKDAAGGRRRRRDCCYSRLLHETTPKAHRELTTARRRGKERRGH